MTPTQKPHASDLAIITPPMLIGWVSLAAPE